MNRWKSTALYRQTREWFPELRPDVSAWALTLERKELSKLILIFTGHNFWKRHDWLVNRELLHRGRISEDQLEPPYCNICLTPPIPRTWSRDMEEYLQTSHHIFSTCEGLAPYRKEVLGWWSDVPLHEIKRKNILKFVEVAGIQVFPEAHEEVMAIDRSDLIDNNENDIIEDV